MYPQLLCHSCFEASVVGYYTIGPGDAYYPTTQTQIATPSIVAGTPATVTVPGTDSDGVPKAATAVLLDLTDTAASQASTVTAWPTGTTQPTVAHLTFPANTNATGPTTVNSQVIVPLGTGGKVSIADQTGIATIAVTVDGYFADPSNSSVSTCTYDGAGRLTQAAMDNGATTYTYTYVYGTTSGLQELSRSRPARRLFSLRRSSRLPARQLDSAS